MKYIQADIEKIFAKVDSDLEALKGFGEDFDVLRTYYMDTLNISATILYANRLKEQRERARIAEEARIKAEEERRRQEMQAQANIPLSRPNQLRNHNLHNPNC